MTSAMEDGQGTVDHSAAINEAFAKLLLKDNLSDVTFKVGGEQFPAHKLVRAARNEVFRAMFFGNFSESSKKEVEIKETSPAAFKQFVKYLYTGQLTLNEIDIKDSVELIKLAHMYQMSDLQSPLTTYLEKSIRMENVCELLMLTDDNTEMLADLRDSCLDFVDVEAAEVLKCEDFVRLPPSLLQLVLQRDTLSAPEIDVFEALKKWLAINHNVVTDEEKSALLKSIQLHLLTDMQIITVVRDSKLYSREVLMESLASIKLKPDANPGYLSAHSTVTIAGAEVIEGTAVPENGSLNVILDGNGDRTNFVRHVLGDGNGVTVKLARPFSIGKIWFKIHDYSNCPSYSVETSADGKRWTCAGTGSNPHYNGECVSFRRRPVMYFRIKGITSLNGSSLDMLEVMAE